MFEFSSIFRICCPDEIADEGEEAGEPGEPALFLGNKFCPGEKRVGGEDPLSDDFEDTLAGGWNAEAKFDLPIDAGEELVSVSVDVDVVAARDAARNGRKAPAAAAEMNRGSMAKWWRKGGWTPAAAMCEKKGSPAAAAKPSAGERPDTAAAEARPRLAAAKGPPGRSFRSVPVRPKCLPAAILDMSASWN